MSVIRSVHTLSIYFLFLFSLDIFAAWMASGALLVENGSIHGILRPHAVLATRKYPTKSLPPGRNANVARALAKLGRLQKWPGSSQHGPQLHKVAQSTSAGYDPFLCIPRVITGAGTVLVHNISATHQRCCLLW